MEQEPANQQRNRTATMLGLAVALICLVSVVIVDSEVLDWILIGIGLVGLAAAVYLIGQGRR